jgi:uncharacterized membrane protein SpoIIM required for sporulation
MVVEYLLPARWLEKKTHYAFFIGSFYSIIGIIIAKTLFPQDPSLVAVAFTSILLLPLLRKLFTIEERQQKMNTKFSVIKLFKDQGDFIAVYFLIALGIFATYCIASMLLSGFDANSLFKTQLSIRGASGGATFTSGLFIDILINNWWVLAACVLLSWIAGDGAIFLITWNASLWGTIFGITAKTAAHVAETNPWWYLTLVLLIVAPHAIIEMLAYITGGISGGLMSKDLRPFRKHTNQPRSPRALFYSYNITLLIIALVLLVLGSFVETLVLDNATIYRDIIIQSFRYQG